MSIYQHGFVNKRSTQTTTLLSMDFVYENYDKRNNVVCVWICVGPLIQ